MWLFDVTCLAHSMHALSNHEKTFYRCNILYVHTEHNRTSNMKAVEVGGKFQYLVKVLSEGQWDWRSSWRADHCFYYCLMFCLATMNFTQFHRLCQLIKTILNGYAIGQLSKKINQLSEYEYSTSPHNY